MGEEAQPDNYMFKAYSDYYGADDYGDQLIKAAFDGTATSFPDGGNQDFSAMGADGKEQVIKKATAYINTLMYVMYELEDALVVCSQGAPFVEDIHAWDEAVCFYTGSLPQGEGVLAHRLAEKRCAEWGTCNDDETSPLNDKVFELWNKGQEQILEGDCTGARATVDEYNKLWIQPLIQGTLSYAYEIAEMGGGEKEMAEGAVFMAAVVPAINMYNAEAASVIYDNMKFGATPDVAAVKAAFESVYEDIGVTCDEIGGFINENGTYYPGMEPCGAAEVTATDAPADAATPATGTSGGASLAAFATHAVMMIAAVVGFA